MEQPRSDNRYGQARNVDRVYGENDKETLPYEYEGGIEPSPELKGPYQGLSSFVSDLAVGEAPSASTEPILDPKEQMARLLQMKISATLEGDQEKEAQLQKMIALHGERYGISYNEF